MKKCPVTETLGDESWVTYTTACIIVYYVHVMQNQPKTHIYAEKGNVTLRGIEKDQNL